MTLFRFLSSFLYFFKYIFIYLFLAALGLCTWAFFICVQCGLLFVAVRQLLIAVASLAAEHRL